MKPQIYKVIALLIVGILLNIFNSNAQTTSIKMTKDPDKLIRLHVLANSDSPQDQALKYKVRDSVVEYMTSKFSNSKSLEESRKILLDNLPELVAIAEKRLAEEGSQFTINIEHGNFQFPIKSYGTFVLPAGEYEAVRVVIGEGKGANWWCVLFPPLCFVDVSKKNIDDKGAMKGDSFEIEVKQGIKFKKSLKITEVLEKSIKKLNNLLANY